MNVGIISARYANALLKFASADGVEERVYEQAATLEKSLSLLPELRRVIDSPKNIPDSIKLNVLLSAVGGDKADTVHIRKFFALVSRHKRMKYLRFMLRAYMDLYRKSRNIRVGRLVTAVSSDEEIPGLPEFMEKMAGGKVIFERLVDPSIIGGFILELDGNRLDASVASQLKRVKSQFIEKNRRIV